MKDQDKKTCCEKCFVGLFNAWEECSNLNCSCHQAPIPVEGCEHGVVEKYCFKCKLNKGKAKIKGMEVKVIDGHHYVRMKDMEKRLRSERQALVERVKGVQMVGKWKDDDVVLLDDIIKIIQERK